MDWKHIEFENLYGWFRINIINMELKLVLMKYNGCWNELTKLVG
jgi:hypothetical protein